MIAAPKPNPAERIESDSGGVSEAEENARFDQIQKDWRNGTAEKHFVDVLDQVFSNPSQEHAAALDAAAADQLRREEHQLLEAAQKKVSELLRPRGMTCMMACRYIGEPEGYKFKVREFGREGSWDIVISLDDAVAQSAGERDGFTQLCNFIARQAMSARRAHYDKVDALVAEIQGE